MVGAWIVYMRQTRILSGVLDCKPDGKKPPVRRRQGIVCACSASYVVRANSAIFGQHIGNKYLN